MVEFPEIYQSKASPEWATVCPKRSPEFKAHSKKGLAHSAIAYHKPESPIALYHLEVVPTQDNLTFTSTTSATVNYSTGSPLSFKTQWKKVWEYTIPERCDFCEKKTGQAWGRPDVRLPYRWKGRVLDAPVVCSDCYYAQRTEAISEEKRRQDIERLKALRELYPDI